MGRKKDEYQPILTSEEFKILLIKMKEEFGVNQKGIAAKIGVTPTYISCVANGAQKVSALLLQRICDTFGVTFDGHDLQRVAPASCSTVTPPSKEKRLLELRIKNLTTNELKTQILYVQERIMSEQKMLIELINEYIARVE